MQTSEMEFLHDMEFWPIREMQGAMMPTVSIWRLLVLSVNAENNTI